MIRKDIIELFRVPPGKKIRLRDYNPSWAQSKEMKVHPELLTAQKLPPGKQGKVFWEARYEDINTFERHLVRNGTIVADILTTAMLGLDLRYPEITEAQHQALEQARQQLEQE